MDKVLGYEAELVTASRTVAPYTPKESALLERAALSLSRAEAAAAERARSVAKGLVRI